MNNPKNSCPICEGVAKSSTAKSDKKRGPWEEITHLLECHDCRFAWAESAPHAEDLTKYYKEEFALQSEDNGVEKRPHSSDLHMRGQSQILLCRMFYDFDENQYLKILDIGAGYGFSLSAVKKIIPSARRFAIEPSRQRKMLLESDGIKVYQRIFEPGLVDSLNEKYGTIILSHTLEHFPGRELVNVISSLRKILDIGGIVFCEVPNGKFDARRNYPGRHLSFFSKESLGLLFENSGYDVLFLNTCGDRCKPLSAFGEGRGKNTRKAKLSDYLRSIGSRSRILKRGINITKAMREEYQDIVRNPHLVYGGDDRRYLRVLAKVTEN